MNIRLYVLKLINKFEFTNIPTRYLFLSRALNEPTTSVTCLKTQVTVYNNECVLNQAPLASISSENRCNGEEQTEVTRSSIQHLSQVM